MDSEKKGGVTDGLIDGTAGNFIGPGCLTPGDQGYQCKHRQTLLSVHLAVAIRGLTKQGFQNGMVKHTNSYIAYIHIYNLSQIKPLVKHVPPSKANHNCVITFIFISRQINMPRRPRVPLEIVCTIRALHQVSHMKISEIARMPALAGYSRATIYRHAKMPLAALKEDRRKHNKGRPSKLSPRDHRRVLRKIQILRKTEGSFSSRRLQFSAGMDRTVSNRTFRRYLSRYGYRYESLSMYPDSNMEFRHT